MARGQFSFINQALGIDRVFRSRRQRVQDEPSPLQRQQAGEFLGRAAGIEQEQPPQVFDETGRARLDVPDTIRATTFGIPQAGGAPQAIPAPGAAFSNALPSAPVRPTTQLFGDVVTSTERARGPRAADIRKRRALQRSQVLGQRLGKRQQPQVNLALGPRGHVGLRLSLNQAAQENRRRK